MKYLFVKHSLNNTWPKLMSLLGALIKDIEIFVNECFYYQTKTMIMIVIMMMICFQFEQLVKSHKNDLKDKEDEKIEEIRMINEQHERKMKSTR